MPGSADYLPCWQWRGGAVLVALKSQAKPLLMFFVLFACAVVGVGLINCG